jgi:hypothetical protein
MLNRKQRRALINKTPRNEMVAELTKAQNIIKQDAVGAAQSLAKQLASQTIVSVVIPAVQAVLKENFNFTDEDVNFFMEAFSKKTDELTKGDANEHSEENCQEPCCAASN